MIDETAMAGYYKEKLESVLGKKYLLIREVNGETIATTSGYERMEAIGVLTITINDIINKYCSCEKKN